MPLNIKESAMLDRSASRLDFVPLSQIAYNPAINARRDTETDVGELAVSIEAQGLGQPLALRPAGDGYEPIDGGRRLRALKLLVEQGKIAADHLVSAQIRDIDDAEALSLSLATAITRMDLHPADEALSFTDLVAKGVSPEDIAARFGIPLRRVNQRLAIGHLPAEIIAALRADEIALKDAQAFTLLRDPDLALKLFQGGMRADWEVRSEFSKARVAADSPIARYVGRTAYLGAGGTIDEDLFSANAWFSNGKLLNKLFQKKLKSDEKAWLADGWSFVMIELDADSWSHKTAKWPVLQNPSNGTLTPEEEERVRKLRNDVETLQRQLEGGLDEDATERLRETITAVEGEIWRLTAGRFSPEQKKKSGVTVRLIGSQIAITFGVMKPAAAKKEAKASAQKAPDTSPQPSEVRKVEPEAEADFTHALAVEMARVMTHAMQAAIIDKPSHSLQLAAALLMLLGGFHKPEGFILEAPQRRNAEVGEKAAASYAADGFIGELLKDSENGIARLYGASIDLLDHQIARAIAPLFHCSASNIDALRPLIDAFDPDIASIWAPDEGFFKRMPRESLAAALGEAAIAGITPSKKKKELIEMAVRDLVPLGWLPKPLRTPSYVGPGSNAWADAHAEKTADAIARNEVTTTNSVEEDAA